jgi:hypothetical protein
MWSDEAREAAAEARAKGGASHQAGVNSVGKPGPKSYDTLRSPSGGSSWGASGSDKTWQASQPKDQYVGHIADLLGMWEGSPAGNHKPSPLSDGEKSAIDAHYGQRTDPHLVAALVHANRTSV